MCFKVVMLILKVVMFLKKRY